MPPIDSRDILRHLFTGLLVHRDGLSSLSLPLAVASPTAGRIAPWSNIPYNYPPIAVIFFWCLTGICPSVFAAKLVLTVCEGVNGILVGRIVGSRWAGIAYWLSPLSIWWVSREGQFEPIQTLPLLSAWLLMRKYPITAAALFAIAIQAKLTSLALLPFFFYRLATNPGCVRWKALLSFFLALTPSLLFLPYYPLFSNLSVMSRLSTRFNPWNVDPRFHWWWPAGLVWVAQAGIGLSVVVLACMLWRSRKHLSQLIAWAAPAGFLVFAKVAGVFQPWYWLVQTSFLVTTPRGISSLLLAGLLLVVEPLSSARLLRGPTASGGRPFPVSVFEKLALPETERR